jgi:hypothetical protein
LPRRGSYRNSRSWRRAYFLTRRMNSAHFIDQFRTYMSVLQVGHGAGRLKDAYFQPAAGPGRAKQENGWSSCRIPVTRLSGDSRIQQPACRGGRGWTHKKPTEAERRVSGETTPGPRVEADPTAFRGFFLLCWAENKATMHVGYKRP